MLLINHIKTFLIDPRNCFLLEYQKISFLINVFILKLFIREKLFAADFGIDCVRKRQNGFSGLMTPKTMIGR